MEGWRAKFQFQWRGRKSILVEVQIPISMEGPEVDFGGGPNRKAILGALEPKLVGLQNGRPISLSNLRQEPRKEGQLGASS